MALKLLRPGGVLVLFGLIIRAVAFEWRHSHHTPAWDASWTWVITTGSLIAALGIGAALGATTLGLPIDGDGTRVGGPFSGLGWPALLVRPRIPFRSAARFSRSAVSRTSFCSFVSSLGFAFRLRRAGCSSSAAADLPFFFAPLPFAFFLAGPPSSQSSSLSSESLLFSCHSSLWPSESLMAMRAGKGGSVLENGWYSPKKRRSPRTTSVQVV